LSAMASDKRSYRNVADGTFSFGGGQPAEHGLHEVQVRGQPAEDQRDDPLHEPWLVVGNARLAALSVPGLPQHSTCPAFGHLIAAEHVTHMLDRLTPLRRA
jgi:hypothetical protein